MQLEHQAPAPRRVQPGTLWGTERPLPLRKLRAGGRLRALPWGELGHPCRPAARPRRRQQLGQLAAGTAPGGAWVTASLCHRLTGTVTADRGRPETKTQPGLPGAGEPRSSEAPCRAAAVEASRSPACHRVPCLPQGPRCQGGTSFLPFGGGGHLPFPGGPRWLGMELGQERPGCWGPAGARSIHPLLWGQRNDGHGHFAGLERQAPGFRLQSEF